MNSVAIEQEVTRLEREVGEAITRRDLAALDRLIADDFLNTNPRGQVMTKQEAIASLTEADYELESICNEEVRVRVFDEVAVATGVGTAKGRYRGQEAVGRCPYLRVWVRRHGRWQAVAAQATSLPEA
jgi:hypothetical protein